MTTAMDPPSRRRTTHARPPHRPSVARDRASRPLVVAIAALIAGTVASVAPAAPVAAAPGDGTPTYFVPVTPCRLIDTRTTGGPIPTGGTIDVRVADRCGVGGDALAAAITVTVDQPAAAGFVSAYPSGEAWPETSTVNYRAGQTVANGALVRLGNGVVRLLASGQTHVVVDVTGFFRRAPSDGVRSGRYTPIVSRRVLDTRGATDPAAGATMTVDPGVPDGAVAAIVNVTIAGAAGPDYLTIYPHGRRRPVASVVNTDRAGQIRAGAAMVPLDDGKFDVYTLAGSDIVVDVFGYMTGPSADRSTDGLFVPIDPERLADTRTPNGARGGPRLWDDGAREFATAPVIGPDAAAVVTNLTAVDTEDAGHLTAWPAGTAPPPVSNVNYQSAQLIVPNLAILQVSDRGIAVSAFEATELVVDITGWFTGTPVEATRPVPANTPPPDRVVTIISDSAMAGVRWNGALPGLQGFEARAYLESCRRLVQASCRGREGYAPRTAQMHILSLPQAGPEEILVIAVGYNDWYERFGDDFDAVVGAARMKGFHHIAWVSYRSNGTYRLPSSGLRSNYAAMNEVLRAKVASGDYPEVRIWEFEHYTGYSSGWFGPDGVHETRVGSWGVADWISRHVRAFDDRPCVQPWTPAAGVHDACPNPDDAVASLGVPDVVTIYGL